MQTHIEFREVELELSWSTSEGLPSIPDMDESIVIQEGARIATERVFRVVFFSFSAKEVAEAKGEAKIA